MLFELATAKWLAGERLEVVQLASELGVSRATAFRWVGTREQLYGEVISAVYARQRERILRTTPGRGIERFARVARRNLRVLLQSTALRKFIAHDPEFAIRVLTSKSSPVQARSMELESELLRETVKEAKIRPIVDLETLAFLIVRVGEAFLYADVMSGRKPEIEKAVAAICLLVAGKRQAARSPKRKSAKPAR
jgi:AcrR family transcriptional regulator